MPILASSAITTGYGKSFGGVAAVVVNPLNSAEGSTDAFVTKYNTSGKVQWMARLATNVSDISYGITTDTTENIYVTGQYGASNLVLVAFNADGTAGPTITNVAGADVFIAKYNSSGVAQWATKITSTGTDIGYAIATDSSGNVYIAGQGGSGAVVTAHNASGTAFGTTLANAGGTDAFVVKYNASGVVQWIARIASTGTDIGYAIASDSSGNVYVTGQGGSGAVVTAFSSNGVAFGTTLANAGGLDAFVAKYNTSGTVQWLARIASTGDDIGYGVASDSSGNVYVSGLTGNGVTTTAYNADGSAFATTLATIGQRDVFLVKYNSSGVIQWVTRIGSNSSDLAYNVIIDPNGDLYIGFTQGSNAIGTAYNSNGTAFGTTLPNINSGDACIVKYNSAGFVQWVARVGGQGGDNPFGMATDSSGNLYVTGQYNSTLTAFNANGTSFGTTVSNAGALDAFLVKYNSSGTVQWLTRLSSPMGDVGRSVSTDATGNVITTGQFQATAYGIYGQSRYMFTTLPNAGSEDAFIVKYNTSGAPQWAARLASTGTDIGSGTATDIDGNLYATGRYTGTLTAYNADTTAFGTTLTNSGTDCFIVKYNTSGVVQWLAKIASTTQADIGYAIATDSSGNVYVTGQGGSGAVVTAFSSDGNAFGTTLANAGNTDVFTVKYDTSGIVQWVARVASTGADIGFSIATDSSGNVYVTGQGAAAVITAFSSNGVAFGTTLASAGGGDCFLVKYNTSGTVQWVARVASVGTDIGYAIASDSTGNVYITGQVGTGSTTAFNANGTAFGTTIANIGLSDVFLVKYDTNGSVQWITRLGSTQSDIGRAITADTSGNVYLSGTMSFPTAGVTLYNSDGTAYPAVFPNLGTGVDGFVVKYNTNGFVQWYSRAVTSAGNTENMFGLKTDSTGNVYVCGRTQSNVAFDIYDSTQTRVSSVYGQFAMVKYNTNGLFQWAQVLSSSGNLETNGIAVDATGNSYVTGYSIGGLKVYNMDTTPYIFARYTGTQDGFIVKYSPTMTPLWVATIASVDSTDSIVAIATDSDGSVYVSGQPSSTVITAYNATGTAFGTTVQPNEAFVFKYNTSGVVQWVGRITSPGSQIGYGVATDSSKNVYMTGQGGNGTLTIYNASGTTFGTLANGGSGDCFVVKYNTSGVVQWAARVAAASIDIGWGITVDSTSNVYITGQFANATTLTAFNADKTAFGTTITSSGGTDIFLVKYDTTGVVQWLAKISTTNADIGYAVTSDTNGNIYVTGRAGANALVATAYNANGTAFSTTFTVSGASDCFVVKYDTSGTVQWLARISSTAIDIGYAIAADSSGNVYVTGAGGSSVATTAYNANGTAFGTTIPFLGSNEAFLIKYDTNGSVQWVALIGSTGGNDIGYAVCTDSSQNVYVTAQGGSGTALSAFNADGTLFGSTMTPLNNVTTSIETFIVKYNSSGVVQWISALGPGVGSGTDSGYAIAVDSSQNLYLGGSFSSGGPFTAYDA